MIEMNGYNHYMELTIHYPRKKKKMRKRYLKGKRNKNILNEEKIKQILERER
jgi:hypothetical protein